MNPTKSSMIEKLEIYLIVTAITVLIWLYAEGENVKEYPSEQIKVIFVAPSGDELFIQPHEEQRITTVIECATSQYSTLQRLMNERRRIEIEVKYRKDERTQVIDLQQEIQNSIVGALGVTVKKTVPATLPIIVERFDVVTLSAKVVSSKFKLSEASCDPEKVEVKVPQHLAETIRGIIVHADVDAAIQELGKLEDGRSYQRSIAFSLPPEYVNADLAITPATANVRFAISNLPAKTSISNVPIYTRLPIGEMNNYKILTDNGLRFVPGPVQLSGPGEVIDMLNSRKVPITAELRLTTDELEQAITSKILHIDVPPGVEIISLPRLKFSIQPHVIENN